jgi:hypothetical protein
MSKWPGWRPRRLFARPPAVLDGGRPEPDRSVVRKGIAFDRQSEQPARVELSVAVLVMIDVDAIGAWGDAIELDAAVADPGGDPLLGDVLALDVVEVELDLSRGERPPSGARSGARRWPCPKEAGERRRRRYDGQLLFSIKHVCCSQWFGSEKEGQRGWLARQDAGMAKRFVKPPQGTAAAVSRSANRQSEAR